MEEIQPKSSESSDGQSSQLPSRTSVAEGGLPPVGQDVVGGSDDFYRLGSESPAEKTTIDGDGAVTTLRQALEIVGSEKKHALSASKDSDVKEDEAGRDTVVEASCETQPASEDPLQSTSVALFAPDWWHQMGGATSESDEVSNAHPPDEAFQDLYPNRGELFSPSCDSIATLRTAAEQFVFLTGEDLQGDDELKDINARTEAGEELEEDGDGNLVEEQGGKPAAGPQHLLQQHPSMSPIMKKLADLEKIMAQQQQEPKGAARTSAEERENNEASEVVDVASPQLQPRHDEFASSLNMRNEPPGLNLNDKAPKVKPKRDEFASSLNVYSRPDEADMESIEVEGLKDMQVSRIADNDDGNKDKYITDKAGNEEDSASDEVNELRTEVGTLKSSLADSTKNNEMLSNELAEARRSLAETEALLVAANTKLDAQKVENNATAEKLRNELKMVKEAKLDLEKASDSRVAALSDSVRSLKTSLQETNEQLMRAQNTHKEECNKVSYLMDELSQKEKQISSLTRSITVAEVDQDWRRLLGVSRAGVERAAKVTLRNNSNVEERMDTSRESEPSRYSNQPPSKVHISSRTTPRFEPSLKPTQKIEAVPLQETLPSSLDWQGLRQGQQQQQQQQQEREQQQQQQQEREQVLEQSPSHHKEVDSSMDGSYRQQKEGRLRHFHSSNMKNILLSSSISSSTAEEGAPSDRESRQARRLQNESPTRRPLSSSPPRKQSPPSPPPVSFGIEKRVAASSDNTIHGITSTDFARRGMKTGKKHVQAPAISTSDGYEGVLKGVYATDDAIPKKRDRRIDVDNIENDQPTTPTATADTKTKTKAKARTGAKSPSRASPKIFDFTQQNRSAFAPFATDANVAKVRNTVAEEEKTLMGIGLQDILLKSELDKLSRSKRTSSGIKRASEIEETLEANRTMSSKLRLSLKDKKESLGLT